MQQSHFLNIQIILSIILVLGFLLLFFAERKWPLRKPTRPLLSRIVINLTFTALVYIFASLLISPSAKFIIQKIQIHQFGLLPWLRIHGPLNFIIGFLLMDLTFYYWHRMNHEIPWLWRFHNVHHVDPDLDVTTSMRFHFVEIAYSSIFRLAQLSLIGLNPITFFCYEFFFQANTFFQHSNIKLPIRLEKIINKIIVTPRMHGIHHSDYQDELNRNYGVVFSFWDHLHKTIRLNVPQTKITIGVPAYLKPSDNRFLNLVFMPFKSQRHYWRISGKSHMTRGVSQDKCYGNLSE